VSTHREEHLELCAGYALGCLDERDRRELEAHLAGGCSVCEQELRRLGAVAVALAAAAPRMKAPAALRGRVLDAIGSEPNVVPLPRRRTPALTWAWAAAAMMLTALGVFQWRATQRLERELEASRTETERLRRGLTEERRWADLSASPRAVSIPLAPTPAGPADLHARVTYDPESHRALIVCVHFTPPSDKDYQLWAILKSGPSSLGLVHADPLGNAVIRVPDVGDPAALEAFAVSLEAKGGAPTPHAPAGAVVMVGKVGG